MDVANLDYIHESRLFDCQYPPLLYVHTKKKSLSDIVNKLMKARDIWGSAPKGLQKVSEASFEKFTRSMHF